MIYPHEVVKKYGEKVLVKYSIGDNSFEITGKVGEVTNKIIEIKNGTTYRIPIKLVKSIEEIEIKKNGIRDDPRTYLNKRVSVEYIGSNNKIGVVEEVTTNGINVGGTYIPFDMIESIKKVPDKNNTSEGRKIEGSEKIEVDKISIHLLRFLIGGEKTLKGSIKIVYPIMS